MVVWCAPKLVCTRQNAQINPTGKTPMAYCTHYRRSVVTYTIVEVNGSG